MADNNDEKDSRRGLSSQYNRIKHQLSEEKDILSELCLYLDSEASKKKTAQESFEEQIRYLEGLKTIVARAVHAMIMNRKARRAELKEIEKEYEHCLKVIADNYTFYLSEQAQIALLMQMQKDLQITLDRIDAEIKKLTAKNEKLDKLIGLLESKIKELTKDIESNNERIMEIAQDICKTREAQATTEYKIAVPAFDNIEHFEVSFKSTKDEDSKVYLQSLQESLDEGNYHHEGIADKLSHNISAAWRSVVIGLERLAHLPDEARELFADHVMRLPETRHKVRQKADGIAESVRSSQHERSFDSELSIGGNYYEERSECIRAHSVATEERSLNQDLINSLNGERSNVSLFASEDSGFSINLERKVASNAINPSQPRDPMDLGIESDDQDKNIFRPRY